MSRIAITGTGAVSAAGWGTGELMAAVASKRPIAPLPIDSPAGGRPLPALRVPAPAERPPFARHPRLRRASPIAKFALSAALEALGADRTAAIADGSLRCGIIFSVMNAAVNHSARFYGEVLATPGMASPIVFPETVLNAPSSHLSAYLGSTAPNDTLAGDEATFISAVDLAARWLSDREVDACLVVGAEEADWLTAEARHILHEPGTPSEGAGALLLERWNDTASVELALVTDPFSYAAGREIAIARALQAVANTTPRVGNAPGTDIDPRATIGHSMGASTALDCVVAASLPEGAAVASAGSNQQAASLIIQRPHHA